ncbi:hypothetical protein QTP88_023625 [Uroleucon formosanum]
MESTNGNQFIGGIRRLPIAEPNASEIGAYTSKWLRDKVLMAAQRKESLKIPNEILSLIGKKSPDILAKMYNRCLRESVFSVTWKRARLLLLHKSPDKPVTNPYSFRLISMLDTVGKLVGFADDLAIFAAAQASDALTGMLNPTFDAIDAWMGDHGLQIARHKTEAIMLTKKWAYPVLLVGRHLVP